MGPRISVITVDSCGGLWTRFDKMPGFVSRSVFAPRIVESHGNLYGIGMSADPAEFKPTAGLERESTDLPPNLKLPRQGPDLPVPSQHQPDFETCEPLAGV